MERNGGSGVAVVTYVPIPNGTEDEAMIGIEHYCAAVASDEKLSHVLDHQYRVTQITEALGGILNLFLGLQFRSRTDLLRMRTTEAFASKDLPLPTVLAAIRCCCGTNTSAAEQILRVLQEKLLENFPRVGARCILGPLGSFTLVNSQAQAYDVVFRDPASDHYDRFLY